MTVTANTIIRDAMREIGAIGMAEVPEPDDSQHALRLMNRMLDAWLIKGLYAYHVKWQSVTLTEAMQTRTIGPSGDVNIARPVRIEVGSYSRTDGTDEPLRIASRDEWARIEQKTLVGERPTMLYYETASPLGTLYFWPQADCTAFLAIQTQLTQFADLSTAYTLPPGYEDAITLSLSERLCRPFSRPVPVTLRQDAMNARNAIKNANTTVPELKMPIGDVPVMAGLAGFLAG